MYKNSSLKEIAEKFYEAESVLLFPHVNPDGDTLGSCVSLLVALRKLGKKCWILTDAELAGNLTFMDNGYCVMVADESFDKKELDAIVANGGEICLETQEYVSIIEKLFGTDTIDVCAAIDCSEIKRFPKLESFYKAGLCRIAVDHHEVDTPQADMCYIDAKKAANAENMYLLLKELEKVSGQELFDVEIGSAIYAGIVTDTGNFQYSNTTVDTHKICIELYELGIDHTDLSVKIFQNARKQKLTMLAKIVDNMEIICDGKVAMSYVTQAMLKEEDAKMDETDGSVEKMRGIEGVEVAMLIKEYGENECKVSMRAKYYADVNEICKPLGGGGHARAAGCTLFTSMAEARSTMKKALIDYFDKLENN